MTARGLHRSRGIFPALLLAAGMLLLQAFIGGRGLLFAYPGLSVIALAGIIAIAFVRSPKTRADGFCLAATGIFLGYILVRAALTPGYFARADLFSAMGALVVYGVTATALSSARARLAVIASLLAFAMLHVLIGAMQFSRGDNFMLIPFLQRVDYGQRASGFYVCPNHLAGLLEVVGILGLSITCWSRWPIWAKLLVGYATGICYLGLALTGSRGGYISALASLIAFAVLSLLMLRKAYSHAWLRYAVGAGAAVGLVFAIGTISIHQSAFLSDRASKIIDRKNVRTSLWRAAVKQWQLEPIIGTGAGTYRFYGRQFRIQDMQNDPVDVHNDYLHLLCEYGVVGAAAFLLLISAHGRQGLRSVSALLARIADSRAAMFSDRGALFIGAWSAAAAYAVHSAVDFNLHIPANAIFLAFVFGIIANPGLEHNHSDESAAVAASRKFPSVAVAVVLLIQSLRLAPGEYYTERARTALRDEEPAASLVFARHGLRYERNNPELFFYSGRALLASAHSRDDPAGRAAFFEQAIESFSKASALAPLDGGYALNLAFTYDEMGCFEEAERMFAKAKERDPQSAAVAQLYQAHLQEMERTAAATPERSM